MDETGSESPLRVGFGISGLETLGPDNGELVDR